MQFLIMMLYPSSLESVVPSMEGFAAGFGGASRFALGSVGRYLQSKRCTLALLHLNLTYVVSMDNIWS
jgi:hypothetical protein